MNLSELMLTVEELCGVTVAVEPLRLMQECAALRLPHDQYLHHSEFCRKIKFTGEIERCRQNKRRSVIIAEHGRSFCGYCPNGIWDLVMPVFYEEEHAGVVFLGGIQNAPDEKKLRELRMYGRFIARFIVIELQRYAKLTSSHRKRRDEMFYISNSKRFINEKYCEQISLTDLAETLNVDPNHLGKLLRKKLGKTFRQLLCERRMHQGEVLVRLHKTLNFTKIAHLCGFTDSNYFCVVFKNHFGIPPKEYRRRYFR